MEPHFWDGDGDLGHLLRTWTFNKMKTSPSATLASFCLHSTCSSLAEPFLGVVAIYGGWHFLRSARAFGRPCSFLSL